jgi:perosamine synthetase
MIPIFKPSYGKEELAGVKEVFESGWIGMGPKTEEFEQAFAEYVGAKHAIAVNSGTAALHLALAASGIGPGDEVIVPTMTFVSTAHAVVYVGAKPVFCDIDADTLNISPIRCLKEMTARTAAVIPVHYGGHPCRMAAISLSHKRIVIEDAAHACGAEYDNLKIGSGLLRTSATCFSFHAVKNLAMGDGGMISTQDGELAAKLRRLRWCGIDKDTWRRTEDGKGYGWGYQVAELGYKCHMNDIAAAIGLVQLRKLDAANEKRRRLHIRYGEALNQLSWLEIPVVKSYARPSYHNYVIKTDHRDALHLFLRERGISTGVHYIPLHLQPYYYDPAVRLPVAERVWKRLLTLPLYPDLSIAEQDLVIEAIHDFGSTL